MLARRKDINPGFASGIWVYLKRYCLITQGTSYYFGMSSQCITESVDEWYARCLDKYQGHLMISAVDFSHGYFG
jgi:hypothetical protein